MASPSAPTDLDLIDGLARQDVSAIKAVYQQIYGYLMGYARQQGGTTEAGTDLVDDVLLILIQKAQQGKLVLHPGTKLTSFAYGIAKWHWRDQQRKQDRYQKKFPTQDLPPDADDDLPQELRLPDGGPLPDSFEQLDHADCMEKIIEASMPDLPRDDKLLLDLRIREGLDYRTVAQRLGIKESTARQRYPRAVQKLSRLMQRHPFYAACSEHQGFSA